MILYLSIYKILIIMFMFIFIYIVKNIKLKNINIYYITTHKMPNLLWRTHPRKYGKDSR